MSVSLWQCVDAIRAPSLRRHGCCDPALREAHAFADVLGGLPVGIVPGDVLCGDFGPEWEDDKPAPNSRTDRTGASIDGVPPSPEACMREWFHCFGGYTPAHTCVDYGFVVRTGINGLLDRIDHSPKVETGSGQRAAMRLALAALCDWASRFADLSLRLADAATDSAERFRLLGIAERCRRVPRLPCRTFLEGLQCVWLVHAAVGLSEHSQSSLSLGRADQYLWPLFAEDLSRGVGMDTLRAGVRDLFRKLNRYGDAACALNLGGAGAGGEDCFNALSSLFVDVAAELGLPSPILAARIHPGIPDAAFDQLTDPRLLRMGQPTFYGEFPCQEAVARRGVAPAEVHEWAANSCMGLLMPGQEISDMWAGVVPMLLAVELAVNRGMPFEHTVPVDMPDFGHVQRRTFDQLFDDVLRATAALVGYVVERNRAATARVAHESPNPFLSALIDDCILRDRDRADGGARYHTAIVEAFGLMNAADALGAIRALVYERRAVTLREMVAAAKADFVRHEDLLACIRSLPKYGQGDERADAMAARLAAGFAEAVESHNGGTIRYAPSFHTLNAHIAAGRKFGAGLDGRRAGTPLAKNIGPAHDRAAAHTSVMMAACRIDQRRFCGGQALDLSVDAESLVGMRGRAAFQALLQTYFREGGLQVQVNGVTADLLRAARRDPQRHPNVIVRIAGYSARFVALSPDVQDEMIARFDRGL